MSEHIKISKKAVYSGILVVLLLVAGLVYFLYYKPQMDRDNEIKYYKKVLFDSTVCQYSCPLTEQDYQGEKMLLPEVECVQKCVEDLKGKNLDPDKFSNQDLENDALIQDLQTDIEGCRTASMFDEEIDAESFFGCTQGKLTEIKMKYEYLAD